MDNNCDNSIKAPKVGHKMGYCTKRFFKKTLCGNCFNFVYEVHQVNKYDSDFCVCGNCFDQVRANQKNR